MSHTGDDPTPDQRELGDVDHGAALAALQTATDQLFTQSLFRQIIDGLPDGLVVVNSDRKIVLVNRRVELMLGYSATQLVGKQLSTLLPETARGGHDDLIDGYFMDPRPRPMSQGRVLTARHRTGRDVPVTISLGAAVADSGVVAIATLSAVPDGAR